MRHISNVIRLHKKKPITVDESLKFLEDKYKVSRREYTERSAIQLATPIADRISRCKIIQRTGCPNITDLTFKHNY